MAASHITDVTLSISPICRKFKIFLLHKQLNIDISYVAFVVTIDPLESSVWFKRA